MSANGIHHRRLQFLRHWHGYDRLEAEDMVTFALYPWHTSGLAAQLDLDANLLWTFVFEPIAALGSPPSKVVASFRGLGGLQIIAEKHPGSPYPPTIAGVTRMQKALANAGTSVQ